MTVESDHPTFLSARPNLLVRDIAASAAFYRDILGFEVKAMMGEPPNFALLTREGAELALLQHENPTPSGCYIYVTGVRLLRDHRVAAGARVTYPLRQEPWDLLNFVIADPDEHQIAMGERTGANV